MKKEPKLLLTKAVNSLVLSVELFNRPNDTGRVDAVLLVLDHAFEMLLKAAILHRGGRIREPRAKNTIGFEKCIRVGVSDGVVRFLSAENALLLQAINEHRNAAQHHLSDTPEELLYMLAQGGLTLFRDLLHSVFGEDLSQYVPARVLPISTKAPTDMAMLFGSQVAQVVQLLAPGRRRRTEAVAKLRALSALDRALSGDPAELSDGQLLHVGEQLAGGKPWQDVFPGAAAIEVTTEGSGLAIAIRVSKKEGIPVQVVPEGSAGGAVVAIRRVNELDYYNLSHKQLAEHLGITAPKLTALVWHSQIKEDDVCFKVIVIGKVGFDRYSQAAISRLREHLAQHELDDVWRAYRSR